MPNFPDLAALNDWLERRCMELWHEIPHGGLPGSVADVWAEEQAALMSLPPAFDGFVEHEPSASRPLAWQAMLGIAERGPDQLRTQSLKRSGVFCEPPCQPAGLSRTARRGRRRADPV